MKPFVHILRILGIVAVTEFWVMVFLWYVDLQPGFFQFFIDSLLLSLTTAPFLYFWIVRPAVRCSEHATLEKQAILNKVLSFSLEDIPLEEVLGSIIDQIVSIKRFNLKPMGGIWLVEEPGILILKAHKGLSQSLQNICSTGFPDKCMCGRASLSGEIEFYDYPDKKEGSCDGIIPHGYYCIPMRYSGKVIGVINLYVKEGYRRDKKEEEFLHSIADIAAGIIQRKQIEKALMESEEKFQKISYSAQDAFVMIDGDGKISCWNPASERIFGYACEEVLGRDLHTLLAPRHYYAAFRKGFDKFRTTGQGPVIGKTSEVTAVRKGGCEFPAELSVSAVKINGKWNSIGIIRDITERKHSEEKICYIAYHDYLTGLPNRMLLIDRLNQAIALSRRHGLYAAVLFLDLNRFKYINDTLGHSAGDEMLREVSERLTGSLRATDTIARLGGDEFTIVLPDVQRIENVVNVVEKVFSVLSEPFSINGYEFFVTTGVGISIFPDDGEDAETLLKNADIAMYRAKDEGIGNNYVLYTPSMNERTHERLRMEGMLRKALERREFLLHYQPQVALNSGEITGVEALVRWQEPERGLIPPGEFIVVAEDTGLIIPLGEWILRNACMANKEWQDKGLKSSIVAVNLSLRQFKQKDFVGAVARILKETRLDPRCLELELTESILMENAEATIDILRALKEVGIRLTIDDFGTGYSSLEYLRRMPIDMLKIAIPFVRDITKSPDDASIVTAIIKMAHCLNIKVIAEGVETVEQLALLRSLGCDKIQGFLVSRPLPPDEIEEFLKKGARFVIQ